MKRQLCALLSVLSLAAFLFGCSDRGKVTETESAASESVSETTGAETEAVTLDTPVVPPEKGLLYCENIPEHITVSANSHDFLNLWTEEQYIPYWTDGDYAANVPAIKPFLYNSTSKRPFFIVCPGGGYRTKADDYEGAAIASYIVKNWKCSACVLNYRVAPYDYHATLTDVLRAVRFARYYAEDLHIDPDKIFVVGFSAGGHLSLMSGEKFDYGVEGDVIDNVSSRPNGVIGCYPVVCMDGTYTHSGSASNFLGNERKDASVRKKFSADLAVRTDTPPMFFFHCKDDATVDYQNSVLLDKALTEKNILHCFKSYETGGHGGGLYRNKEAADWPDLCFSWLKDNKLI